MPRDSWWQQGTFCSSWPVGVLGAQGRTVRRGVSLDRASPHPARGFADLSAASGDLRGPAPDTRCTITSCPFLPVLMQDEPPPHVCPVHVLWQHLLCLEPGAGRQPDPRPRGGSYPTQLRTPWLCPISPPKQHSGAVILALWTVPTAGMCRRTVAGTWEAAGGGGTR